MIRISNIDSIAHVCTTINPVAPYLWQNLDLFDSHGFKSFIILDSKKPSYDDPRFVDFNSTYQNIYEKIAPSKSYSRKNIGFLRAKASNCDWIFETDDDNRVICSPITLLNCFKQEYEQIESPLVANIFDCIYDSGESNVWARGYPLNLIETTPIISKQKYFINPTICPVVQFLVNNEPDVDAILRLVLGRDVTFSIRKTYSGFLLYNTYHPFNSQGTLWHKSALSLAYLPSTCNFRMTDIYRGYIAQHILYSNNQKLLFHSPL